MAEALLGRALEREVFKEADVCVAEPVSERRAYLATTYSVMVTDSNTEAIGGAGLVVLAIKPQHFEAVAQELAGKLVNTQTVLSIMAGTPLKRLSKGLSHSAIIRVMPNTPAQVGEGASVWTATPEVSQEALTAATALLEAIGYQTQVSNEDRIDAATAVSGSGPAYVFRFMEALTTAAVARGLPLEIALKLVEQTVYGAALLAKQSDETPSRLRELVTSPGGTTASALQALTDDGFDALVETAVTAAYWRAKELGNIS